MCLAALARIFVMKIGVLPERVLTPLLNDRMVAKGTILAFVTDFFVDFLATGSVDDLVRQPSGKEPCARDMICSQARLLGSMDGMVRGRLYLASGLQS